MAADESFRAFIRRVRAGDPAAAAELVRRYQPEIRRFVRLRLTDPGLHRFLDASDICQSVLANFFVRLVGGQFDLDEPDQLVKLLVRMARNKLVDHARRPASRNQDGDSGMWAAVRAADLPPGEALAREELLHQVRGRLTEEELSLAEQRAEGRGWQEIAAQAGGTPDALRKKLERALDRVCRDLGIDGESHAGADRTAPR